MVLETEVFLIVGGIGDVKGIGLVAIVIDFRLDVVVVTVVDLVVVGIVAAVEVEEKIRLDCCPLFMSQCTH